MHQSRHLYSYYDDGPPPYRPSTCLPPGLWDLRCESLDALLSEMCRHTGLKWTEHPERDHTIVCECDGCMPQYSEEGGYHLEGWFCTYLDSGSQTHECFSHLSDTCRKKAVRVAASVGKMRDFVSPQLLLGVPVAGIGPYQTLLVHPSVRPAPPGMRNTLIETDSDGIQYTARNTKLDTTYFADRIRDTGDRVYINCLSLVRVASYPSETGPVEILSVDRACNPFGFRFSQFLGQVGGIAYLSTHSYLPIPADCDRIQQYNYRRAERKLLSLCALDLGTMQIELVGLMPLWEHAYSFVLGQTRLGFSYFLLQDGYEKYFPEYETIQESARVEFDPPLSPALL
ncbi:hypothetical protein KIPB_007955 [Kipferlia bialata]|uniref:Uncharacterized protein n=1 Tax=Kipferlia bialata TaxID=797122 RepID=A0A9K3GKX9_9EUKA|nr:hypothetical protein KIPB_007955 [Kipferlia bialata]|eukprot:g7955.t1